MHLQATGKGSKIRYVPMHALAQSLIEEYLAALGKHGGGRNALSLDGPLFRPVANNRTGTLDKHLDPRLDLQKHRHQIRSGQRDQC